ncbi:MAG: hypothetical protein IPO64_01535 [Bacteroidetes bacterium]|nr:hypothetical protein [Bacteroidota bacterium]
MANIFKKITFLSLFIFSIVSKTFAQGDECELGYVIPTVSDYCSAPGQFTNVGATTSGFGKPACWAINSNDVWFSFTAIASDVTIIITGDFNGMGTMKTPEVALYSGSCTGTINELACATSQPNQQYVSLFKAGLTPFVKYYIRVNSRTLVNKGTFQLCINNYLPSPAPVGDCVTAPFLCTNSTATFQFSAGDGFVSDEANNTCLDNYNGDPAYLNSETASSWVKFTATKSGQFTFTITPIVLDDDLDFAFYELPNGPASCTPKTLLRCNASACLNRGGLVGLDLVSTDVTENQSVGNDCNYGTPLAAKKNGWLRYVDLVAGKTYGLLVNNFTTSGNGFSISFNQPGAGLAEIDALRADFTTTQIGGPCSMVYRFTDASVNGAGWTWNFGPNATPTTAVGVGPHTVTYTTPGNYPVILTIDDGTCKDFISYNVNPAISLPAIVINANVTSFCTGGNAILTGPTGYTSYKWYRNGVQVAGATNTLTVTLAGTYYLEVSNGTCTANSNSIAITINPASAVSVSIAAVPSGPICSGTNVTFTATPTNGGAAPVYQWKKNGVNVGSNSVTYSSNTLVNTDKITCVLTSNVACPSGNPATSNQITITVNPNLPVSVSIAANNNGICSGTNVTFTATPTNGGATPVYQWKRNGVNVGANSATYSSTTFANGDIITCVLTSNATCPTGNPATSNQVIMTVNPNLPVSVAISANNNPICAGTNVTFTAVPTNGGAAPVYQWKRNGVNVGANATTYSSSTLVNGDIITCVMTSNATCPTGNPATSNQVVIVVTAQPTASVAIVADANPICAGTNVTFTATPTNGGTPTYQWKLNGVNVGSNSATYSNNTLANGDDITCVMTSSLGCVTGSPATSNQITMTVNPNLPVSVSIAANNNGICSGTNVTFTATPTNGGATPVYQWKKNGVNVGANSATYSSTTFANGDIITCVLTSNATCPTGNPATSNQVVMTVNPNLPVSVAISANNNPICAGTNVTFTAVPTNGGAAPVYQWKRNGVNVGSNATTYSNSTLVNGDIITCVMTSNATCPTGNPATSNQVVITVTAQPTASVAIVADNNSICAGTNVTFTATPTNGGTPTYQWKLNGVNVGSNSATYSNNTLVNGDNITCIMTSSLGCVTGSPATSNQITMTVNAISAIVLNISPSANPICAGTSVTFTGTPANAAFLPVYQWTLNGANGSQF